MSQGPQWEPVEPPAPTPSAPGPMRFGQVLEVGTRILRRHWGVLLLVSLLFAGPGALLSSATAMRFTEVALDVFPALDGGEFDPGQVLTRAQVDRLVEAVIPFLGATLLAGVLGSIGALGFSAVVAEDYHARQAAVGTVLRASLRRTPSALMFMLVTGLMIMGVLVVGLLGMSVATLILPAASVGGGGPGVFLALIVGVATVVALVYLTMRWAPAYPAMIEEDVGWRQALSRSWFLSADNVLRILGLSILVALMTAILSSILGALFEAFLEGLVAPVLGLDALVSSTIALAMAAVIVAPAMAVFIAVLYFDLRARRDPLPPAATRPDAEG